MPLRPPAILTRMSTGLPNKRERQRAILEIVAESVVGSQEELRKLLLARGWDVAQSTLSRDLHELRLARIPTDVGMRYVGTDHSAEAEGGRLALERLLPQLFDRIDGVGELVVLHTVPGGAQPVAAAFDAAAWPDVLGTVGGDDTILIICRSADARERVARRVERMARGVAAE
jgi:transcriptional regulator of arginine metabolism